MSTTTPNMGLTEPTIGVDSGQAWEQAINANSAVIDQHNHTAGGNNGVPIQPAGLNINTDLPFGGNNATGIRTIRFNQQASVAGAADLNCLYVEQDGNLYFNDGAGDAAIQITKSGTVNATSSGISSGTASAAFVSSVLVVNSATATPANIQGGSVLLGNNSSGTHYLTLSPPAAMPANFSIVLPSIPAAQSFVTLDTSGNLTGATPYPLTASAMASQTITQSRLALKPVANPAVAGGVAVSASCGNSYFASSSYTAVTNLAVTITSTGRPIMVVLQADGSGNASGAAVSESSSSSSGGSIQLQVGLNNGSAYIDERSYTHAVATSGAVIAGISETFNIGFSYLDSAASAGSHTYTVYAKSATSLAQLSYYKLVAYEI